MSNSLNLLIIEDNIADAVLIEKYLFDTFQFNYSIDHVKTLREGLSRIDDQFYDVILLDLSLPDEYGENTFFNTKEATETIPIIIMTSTNDIDLALRLVKSGAQDFLIKSEIDGNNLVRSIKYAIERKEIELQLQKIEKKWRSILLHIPSFVVVTDLQGKITYVNQSVIGKKELIGKEFYDLYSADYEIMLKNIFSEILHTQVAKSVEVQGKVSNRFYYVNIAPIFDEKGFITGVVFVSTDIQDQKDIENQLKIRQRIDFLGTLAGGIAHDFNNILGGITASISGLEKIMTDLSPPQKTLLNEIKESSFQASKLISQLQYLSTGKIVKTETIDIFDIVNDVFNLLNRTSNKLIQKINKIEPQTFLIQGDYMELYQVILNLATNAIQAIEINGISADDFIKVDADLINMVENNYLKIEMEDSGGGIPDNIKDKIFEPWFTTKMHLNNPGQGLGLAMVYNIVTNTYQGEIDVKTSLGEGTIFTILLKISKPEIKRENIMDLDQSSVRKGGETILIIEDQKSLRNVIGIFLKECGYKVLSAEDGKVGIYLYEKYIDEIGLTILDLTLPKKSGIEVYEEIKKINPNAKIIITSGYSLSTLQSDLPNDIVGILPKPFTVDQLGNMLKLAFDNTI